MSRLLIVLWFCAGAFALGLLVVNANKREYKVAKIWYVVALILGPIFFCFLLPLIFTKFGDKK